MKFEIVTLFPDYFNIALKQSLLGKAQDKKLFDIKIENPRDYAVDKHKTIDDTPYGGGGGMVMKVEPLDRCLQALGWKQHEKHDDKILLVTSAAGKPFDQKTAVRYSLSKRLTIICGHYLGIDERLSQLYNVEEVSIGDYVLTGGEPAAAVIVDSVARLIPKVLGNFESALGDSYMNQLLGSPCYTKPAEYMEIKVPEVLQSGNHEVIKKFRRYEAIRRCFANRPDLLDKAELSKEEIEFVKELENIEDEYIEKG